MAVARTAVRGLSTKDLQNIHDTLAAGRKPRVVFTEAAGQIAGQLGHVVGLTDPSDSDEWLVVRFGRDELPFSPTDLAIAPRGAARRAEPERRAEPDSPGTATAATSSAAPVTPAVPAPRKEAVVNTSTVDKSAPPAEHKPAMDKPAEHMPAERKPAERKPGRRAARAKGLAGLTVTLAYAEGEWTVGAQQGSKALAKPYVIKPTEALKMVAMLDVPGVHEAVEHIVAAELAEAEQAAERLRSELVEIEARLAELRDVG